MQPSHIKLLLLILLMLGVGGYVLYSTTPAAVPAKKAEQPLAATSTAPSANVTNVHIEKNGSALVVTGQAKSEIEASLTGLEVEIKTASETIHGTFERVTADLLVENRAMRAGTIVVDLKSLNTGVAATNQRLLSAFGARASQDEFTKATYVITRIDKGEERGAIAVGMLTLNQVTKEVSIPFVREGGGLRGGAMVDLSQFGLQIPGAQSVNLKFLLGVK